jgi:uncharacterized protein (TIGR03437 family)
LAFAFVLLALAARLQAQNTQTEQQFIAATASAIAAFQSSLPPATGKIVFSGNLVYANGAVVADATLPLNVLLQYVEGLKAAGAQRIDLNPAVNSINDPAATAAYDALVAHIRELGLQLAMNPQVVGGELGTSPTFQDFQTAAMTAYPALAERYHPDNFVIVHEPTTMDARMGIATTPADWDGFIRAVAPLIQAVSPHTRLGAGGFYDSAENGYFQDFVTIPVLDFMTMDVYADDNFPGLNAWVQLAHSAADPTHPNGKGIYIAETWAPKYLPNPLPPGWQSNPGGLDAVALVGACDADFMGLDASWLQAMATWASVNGMEAITPFTTEAFFYYGSAGHDKPFDATYLNNTLEAIQNGQLSSTGQAYLQYKGQFGIPEATSINSASFATIPSVFTPNCGSAGQPPCNAQTVVAPDELVSVFGPDLATTTLLDGTFPTNLGGTTATLVDISNTSYPVPLFYVSQYQVNYYLPSTVLPGPATLTITSGDDTQTSGVVLVAQVMPGLYTPNQNGQGAAAAVAVIVHADGSRSSQPTFTCSGAAGCVPAAISLAPTDALYIELYGTGIRHVSGLSAVTATVNGQSVPVQYAGPSSDQGEDQVNVQVPQSLFNSGLVNVILTVAGQPPGPPQQVTLDLQ